MSEWTDKVLKLVRIATGSTYRASDKKETINKLVHALDDLGDTWRDDAATEYAADRMFLETKPSQYEKQSFLDAIKNRTLGFKAPFQEENFWRKFYEYKEEFKQLAQKKELAFFVENHKNDFKHLGLTKEI